MSTCHNRIKPPSMPKRAPTPLLSVSTTHTIVDNFREQNQELHQKQATEVIRSDILDCDRDKIQVLAAAFEISDL